MEDENAKRRKAARRNYNDAVRELAAFVRKRDKRVIAHQVPDAVLPAQAECPASSHTSFFLPEHS